MKYYALLIQIGIALLLSACSEKKPVADEIPSLKEGLYSIVNNACGTVGIAFVSSDDTVTINNGVRYPMMSVFKLHQALAVTETLGRTDQGLDHKIHVKSDELDHDTWSPMLKEYDIEDFDISVGELMKYSLIRSDNNASNLLFKYIVSPPETDRIVNAMAEDKNFRICYSESEMKSSHALSYLNHTSPLSAALLIKQVFKQNDRDDSMLDSIRDNLTVVTTGQDRLGAIVPGSDILLFAHKTGSGYRNEAGELMAHNDVGYFRLKDGRDYGLAVFIRDFNGSEEEASAIIASISECVHRNITMQQCR